MPATRLAPVINPGGYNYLLSLPSGHASDTSGRWPLIFFLHGTAERGNDAMLVTRQALPRLLAEPPDLTPAESVLAREIAENFIVVAPQCPPLEVWDEVRLLALLDHIGTQFRVEGSRVYLTGLSMGGFGAWSLAMRHPARFAALVPVCGGGRIADITNAEKHHPAALRSLAVWAFHGARDRVVPVEESQRMIEALRRASVRDVRLTIYPEGEHDAWTKTYANPQLYAWLRGQERAGRSVSQ